MGDVAEALSPRPGSPQKQRFSLSRNSEPSKSSSGLVFVSRKFATASTGWTAATSITRTSSPEKSADGRTRNSSPEKLSGNLKSKSLEKHIRVGGQSVEKAQGAATMAFRRSEMAACTPPFIFGHQSRRVLAGIPPDVASFGIRTSSERLIQGSLVMATKPTLEKEYPLEYIPSSLFPDVSPHHQNLLAHVKYQCIVGNRNFNRDADESAWSRFVCKMLEDIPNTEVDCDKQLMVGGIENRQLLKSVTPIGAPDLRSDLLIEGNPDYPSPFADICSEMALPPSRIDQTLSPTTHRASQYYPAFCVIEVKAEGGDFQEAQTQAAVVRAAILLKAKQIGADADTIPCVPAIVTIGHVWHLNLIYEQEDKIIVTGPWIIGDTLTFIRTLRVVLFVEELRRYASDTWWPKFVDGLCREVLERELGNEGSARN
ncbi:hypothetical protein TWF481_011014 [Arthrobotrys musiformis]|uniref:PD-(D/E)XK nuclease-like domain-containing protein n=1 Tax=Arthrobotrys musiformis TaxID=47236 RepID=A0AAV9VYJ4_9PEZI